MPSGTGPGLPRQRVQQRIRCLAWRRPRRVQLVVDGVRHPCPLLGFQHRRDRPAAQQLPCVRFSVALPPGIGGKRAADFTLEPGGLSVRENLLRLACGAVELWGLNDSLTSSPLRPRWPLLFGIIQKVGKKIIQGGLTSPLEIPRQPPPGPGVPLGTRTAPTGCFAGLFSAKRDARGYLVVVVSFGECQCPRYLHFNYSFLARQACKTTCGRGFQLQLSRPTGQQNDRWARFSVALPPGTGRG